jgi:hypothetical protein
MGLLELFGADEIANPYDQWRSQDESNEQVYHGAILSDSADEGGNHRKYGRVDKPHDQLHSNLIGGLVLLSIEQRDEGTDEEYC